MRTMRTLESSKDPLSIEPQRSLAARSTWVSAAVNIALSAFQVTLGIVAGSQGLIADGVHSLSDLIADFVVLLATYQSGRGADESHPYGHQRFETGASLALGVLLLIVGAGMLWSALHKLENPAAIRTVQAAGLWAVGVSLLAKELLFRYMLKTAERVKSSVLVANAWHARSDAASSLVVGVGILGSRAGYSMLDPIAALIVGLMIGRMGWKFGWKALNELMDHSADTQEVEAIRRTLLETPGVNGVHELRTRKMGDYIIVDVHVEVDPNLTVEAGHSISDAASQRVLARHRVLNVMTHVDPGPNR